MGSSASKNDWTDYKDLTAQKPRGLDAADADRLMRAVWVSYMDPSGFGAVRPTVAPAWMKKDESTNQDELTPLKLTEVLGAGMGGAWPAMDLLAPPIELKEELKDFFFCDPVDPEGKLTGFFNYPETCTQAVFAKNRDDSDGVHLLLSCRGSTNGEDWTTNAWAMKTNFEPQLDDIDGAGDPRCRCCSWGASKKTDPELDQKRKDFGISKQGQVHRGFYEAFLPLRKAIDKLLVEPCMTGDKKIKEVTIVGHSLGGALATLSMAYFLMKSKDSTVKNGIKVTGFTVGSPRVGDEEFRNFVFKNSSGLRDKKLFRQYRVVLDRDIVASVPPYRLRYRHQGRVCKIAQCEDGGYAKLMFKKGQVDDQAASASEVVNLKGHWTPPSYPGIDLVGDHQVPQYYANLMAARKDYMGESWSYQEKEKKTSEQDGASVVDPSAVELGA